MLGQRSSTRIEGAYDTLQRLKSLFYTLQSAPRLRFKQPATGTNFAGVFPYGHLYHANLSSKMGLSNIAHFSAVAYKGSDNVPPITVL